MNIEEGLAQEMIRFLGGCCVVLAAVLAAMLALLIGGETIFMTHIPLVLLMSFAESAFTSVVPFASDVTSVMQGAGSALMGIFYDISIPALIAFSVITQLASIPFFMMAKRT